MIGTTISHYKILEKLGEGGMGVVYKAQDTKLDRVVALKFLPPHLSASETDKARFVKEARAAASLTHQYIATIYEIDEAPHSPGETAQSFIAMEYIEGKTLKERIDEQPLKLKEAIDLAIQAAEGLHAAHEQGIVHRDVKSANIMVTARGQAKIMDFGLAKLTKGSVLLTKQGSTLGTVAYMSPEQARGEGVDHRTDLWSLGVVVYEMISGRLPFRGEFEHAVVYSLLNEDPPPLTSLRSDVPMELERIINKAMAKDPEQRYQHADDLAVDLKRVRTATPTTSNVATATVSPAAMRVQPSAPGRTRSLFLGMIAGGLAVGLGVGWLVFSRSETPPQPVTKFVLPIDRTKPTDGITGFALTPDGSRLAYTAGLDAASQLFLRDMSSFDAQPVPNTRGLNMTALFFSPDGRWLGFTGGGKLSKLSLSGGTPIVICDVPPNISANWGEGGVIVHQREWGSPLWIVSSDANSTPRQLTRLKVSEGERGHISPHMLPGGKSALFTIWTGGSFEEALIGLVDVATGEHTVVLRGGASPRYLASGHLVYSRGSTIMAVPFDLGTLSTTGEPSPILENVRFAGDGGFSYLNVSQSGTIAFISGDVDYSPSVVSIYRGNQKQNVISLRGKNFGTPFLSYDGKKMGLILYGSTYQLGVYDLSTETLTQLTFAEDNWKPVWTPDGKYVTYSSNLGGSYQVYNITADGSGSPEQLFDQPGNPYPSSWSPDGSTLVYVVTGSDTKDDIWLFSQGSEPKNRPFIQGRGFENAPTISPNGRWIAFVSDESGESEVYVRPFPEGSGKWRISNGKGTNPRWNSDGRRIFFARGDEIRSASVSMDAAQSALTVGREERFVDAKGLRNYDVSRAGNIVVLEENSVGVLPDKIHLILNWAEEVRRKTNVQNAATR